MNIFGNTPRLRRWAGMRSSRVGSPGVSSDTPSRQGRCGLPALGLVWCGWGKTGERRRRGCTSCREESSSFGGPEWSAAGRASSALRVERASRAPIKGRAGLCISQQGVQAPHTSGTRRATDNGCVVHMQTKPAHITVDRARARAVGRRGAPLYAAREERQVARGRRMPEREKIDRPHSRRCTRCAGVGGFHFRTGSLGAKSRVGGSRSQLGADEDGGEGKLD